MRSRIKFNMKLIAMYLMLAVFVQALPCLSGSAKAEEPKLELQAEPGFGAANVKQGRWFPVKFTLSNPGENISGDLTVRIANPNENKDYTYVQHVELPQGSTKVVSMLLPGASYVKGNNQIAFYPDSVEKGKPIELSGTPYLETFNIPGETLQVGVLARDADTLNFLAVLNQSGKPVNVLHLKETDIPDSALGLDGLDVLVLNDFASDTLKEEQVQAILTWVQRGGSLILGGGAGYAKTAAPFAAAAPVVYQNTVSVSALPQLASAGEKELPLTEPFTISQAQLGKEAEALVMEGTTPIFAQQAWGGGRVTYAAYDLSLNPIASWNGNPRLWEKVLEAPFLKVNQYQNQIRYGPDPYWDLNRALEYFPTLRPPKLPILAWIMLFYTIVVGPLLYVILRRLDRREWAWLIIPVLAVLTSVCIFQFGAANRGSTMAQAFHTVELDGAGSGTKKTELSLFVPKGGDLDVTLPGKAAVRPFMNSELNQGQQMNVRNELLIRYAEDAASVGIQDIPYSSISKMELDDERLIQTGKLDYTITSLSANSVQGEIMNHTKQDLVDVAVIVNQYYVKIGEIKAGATAGFNTNGGIGISNAYDAANLAFPQPALGGEDTYFHQRSLLNAYLSRKMSVTGGFEPMIIGWSKEVSPLLQVNHKDVSTDQLTLWAQKMKLSFVSPEGNIVIPGSALAPTVTENRLKMSSFTFQNGPYMEIGSGDFVFEYRLPAIASAKYRHMDMRLEANNEIKLELWNGQTQSWELLAPSNAVMMWEEDKLQPYLLEGKTIRMRASTVQPNIMFRFPELSFEGVVLS